MRIRQTLSGRWQPLVEHLDEVARLTAEFAAEFGAGRCRESWLGLWHDLWQVLPRRVSGIT